MVAGEGVEAGSEGDARFGARPRQWALEDGPRDTGGSHLLQFCAYNFDSLWQIRADVSVRVCFGIVGPSRAFTFVISLG